MRKLFYPKLAAGNIKKNSKTYIPYILTCIITVCMVYMISSLAQNQGITEMRGAEATQVTLVLGVWVTAIFAVIFLFYTNSFLVKRRKKEFGLYNVLGMEKRHLSRIIIWETFFIALISLSIGLLLGLLLDKVAFLILLKLLGATIPLGFQISWIALNATVVLFSAIFFLIALNSLRLIHKANPIELLRGGNTGEAEPKAKWALAVLGAICLGLGYYISITTTDPIAALFLFFVAVVLVIVGTYLLFTAGSVAILKLLRKKKSFYYNPKNFISVSGMMYRMKQNAVGLANVCILSTMVLVIVSSTLSLWVGVGDIIDTRYPRDVLLTATYTDESQFAKLQEDADALVKQHHLTAEAAISYRGLSISALESGDTFTFDLSNAATTTPTFLFLVPLADYNKTTGQTEALEDDETLLYSNRSRYSYPALTIEDRQFTIKKQVDSFIHNPNAAAYIGNSHFLVVKDEHTIRSISAGQQEFYKGSAIEIRMHYDFNLVGSEANRATFYKELSTTFNDEHLRYVVIREGAEQDVMALHGGFFFIGVFLGALFLLATILIIYYKQISEGYDDKERFEIMQKVGMSHTEVKRSIRSQILTVFFLPLITAGVHVLFAFPVVTRILAMFYLSDVGLFALCSIGSFLTFALLYGIVYMMTAKVYYKIVKR